MILLWTTLVLVAAYYYCRVALRKRRLDRLTAAIPTLRSRWPLIGNAHIFVGNSERMLKNVKWVGDEALKQKGFIKFWLGSRLYIAVASPEGAQLVLENCLQKDMVYRFMQPWLGNGLFVAPVGLWKSHRKVLLPVFGNRIVEEYVHVFGQQAELLACRLADKLDRGEFDVLKLADRLDRGEFDILKYITACTRDIVFETAMGERMDVQRSPETPYLRARNTVMTIINMRLFKVWLQPDCLFNLTSYAKQQEENIDLTHKFTDEVVKKRRKEHTQRKTYPGIHNNPIKFRVVLDMLFEREIEFTDEQLREHIDSITIAGNDTTALVIAYTLVLLGAHPRVQEKVFAEQTEIFGLSERAADKEDLQRMQYLERVLKESMRLYTVVPIVARTADKDIQLAGCTVPAGTGLVVGAWAMHRSAAVWGPDVDEFEPDRFLPERSVDRHPAAFIPFSYGTRNCIGRSFGMLIMKSVVSRVVRAYRLHARDVGPLKIEMLLYPINGHLLRVQRRRPHAS